MGSITDAFQFDKNRGVNGTRAEEFLSQAERALLDAFDAAGTPQEQALALQRAQALQAQAQVHATLELAEHVWELRHYFPSNY